MNCLICNADNWENLDHLRDQDLWRKREFIDYDKNLGFKICKKCGFATYDKFDEERLGNLYNLSREHITWNKVLEAIEKNEKHDIFLGNILSKLSQNNDCTILDYGAAHGAFLNHVKEKYGIKNIYGTEINTANIEYAKNEYGIKLTRDINKDIKYDMMCFYKVIEHLQNVKEVLNDCLAQLKEGGYVYISLPIYFDELSDIGFGIADNFETIYHPFHVNLFSYDNFKNLLNSVGLKVIKEDKKLYDYTVLCQKCEPIHTLLGGGADAIIDIIKQQKEAINYVYQEPERSIAIYPKYPDAYISFSMWKENFKNYEAQEFILSCGLATCPNSSKIKLQLAKLYLQWDENKKGKKVITNNIKKAEKMFLELMNEYAKDDLYFLMHIIESKYKNNKKMAREYIRKCLELNPARFAEMMQFVGALWKPN